MMRIGLEEQQKRNKIIASQECGVRLSDHQNMRAIFVA